MLVKSYFSHFLNSMSRNKGSFGLGVDETEVKKMLKELELKKGAEKDDISMYSELPKRTFVRKEKPPFGLTVFKVTINIFLISNLWSFEMPKAVIPYRGNVWIWFDC